ncbi:hypothetical protein [Bacillus sp. 1P06AnD]|uniref:hypothetical protein n=1 Tax=Bacillus sp. 1P06AnD TaxID=3132208 RepID=UPI00399F7E9D
MKVVLSVRSDMAYQFVTKLVVRKTRFSDVEFREKNATTIKDLEDAIEFFKADLYIVDRQLEDSEGLLLLLDRFHCEYLVIENDIKAITSLINAKYGLPEKEVVLQVEDANDSEPIYYDSPKKELEEARESKIIEKEIIRTQYRSIPSKVIVVGSLFKGAGSTLLATNLARMIGQRGLEVAYIEHPLIKPYMFDYLQIHIKDNPYYDVAREIQQEGIARSVKNSYYQNKVHWHVIDSRKPPLQSFSYENLLVLSHSIPANILIFDISDRWLDPEVQKFLYLANEIFVCIEPDPIKMDWSQYVYDGDTSFREKMTIDFFEKNKDSIDYQFVTMKYNTQIDVKLWNVIQTKKPLGKLSYIPYPDIVEALFKRKLLYDFEDYNEWFEEELKSVLAKIVPKDFLVLDKRKKISLKGLFNK